MVRVCGILAAGVIGLWGTWSVCADPAPAGVVWQKDLKTAHRLAVAQNKPILIVFGAEWCTFCHKLERNVINQPEMAAYINANFVAVHLDADKDRKAAELLEVDSLPCTVVLSPNADLLGKYKGYAESSKYAAQLAKAKQAYRELQTAQTPGGAVVR
jgi:thioredoxin-related protein